MSDTILYPTKGSVIWSKASGIVQVGGMAPPMADADSLGSGHRVTVRFTGLVDGSAVVYADVPDIILADWRCTPSGWAFSGRTEVKKDLIGEYLSIFECEARYKAAALEQTMSAFLADLTLYDRRRTRRTTTPYTNPDTMWWRLSDILPQWGIPELANSYIAQLSMTDLTNEAQVVNAHVPLNEQIFLVDAYTKSVSMLPEGLSKYGPGAQDITLGEYLDMTQVETIELTGGRGCPFEDPRTNGVGGLMMAVKNTELDDVTRDDPSLRLVAPYTTSVVDQNTSSTWFVDSKRQSNYQRLELYRYLGSRPTILPPEVREWIKDLVVPVGSTTLYDKIVDYAFEYNSAFFDRYNSTQDAYVGLSYTFVKCQPDVTPYKHATSFPMETYQLNVRRNDKVLSGLLDELNVSIRVHLDSVGLEHIIYPWAEQLKPDPHYVQDDDSDPTPPVGGGIGEESTLYVEFAESEFAAARAHVTRVYIDDPCRSTNIDGETGGDPYLFTKSAEETVQYQVGPFLLNLESMFWITPNAATDLSARDPRGVRVWVGPFDSPEKYAMMVPTILTLYKLYKDYDGNSLHEALCIFAKHGYLLKEADIMIAAICDELSKDSPMEYVKRFEQYYSTVNGWFEGQFSRMHGLQYSYAGSHAGLGEAIAALADKQGATNIDDILSRILPGSRVADAQDRAGGAYCKDMTMWMSENGLIRMAYGIEHKPARCDDRSAGHECTDEERASEPDENLIRFCPPLEESRSITSFLPGMIRVESYDIDGTMSVQELPSDATSAMTYVQPRFVQTSTIERTAAPSEEAADRPPADDVAPMSHLVMPTRVTRWDHLFGLKTAVTERLAGKDLRMADVEIDYTDSPGLLMPELTECFSNPTVRRFKLTISGDCSVSLGYSQIVEYVKDDEADGGTENNSSGGYMGFDGVVA